MNKTRVRRGLEHGIVLGTFETPFGQTVATAFLYPQNGALGVALSTLSGSHVGVLSANLTDAAYTLKPA